MRGGFQEPKLSQIQTNELCFVSLLPTSYVNMHNTLVHPGYQPLLSLELGSFCVLWAYLRGFVIEWLDPPTPLCV